MKDSETETTYGMGVSSEERPLQRPRDYLTWEERHAFQQATTALLLQLRITDLSRCL